VCQARAVRRAGGPRGRARAVSTKINDGVVVSVSVAATEEGVFSSSRSSSYGGFVRRT
jgi:hypothetical protein